MKRCHDLPTLALKLSLFSLALGFFLGAGGGGPTEAAAQIPAAPQSGAIALTGGTVHTVSGAVLQNATVVFVDGRITAVGANVEVPAGARRVDISGRHVYPGLMDGWSQMGLYEIGAVDVTVDVNELGLINPNVRAEVAVNPESRHIGTTRSNGVLVAVSSPSGGLISGLSAAMMLDGWTWQDMTLQAPVGLLVNWPNPGVDEGQYARSISELRTAFQEARAYHVAHTAAQAEERTLQRTDSRWEAMIPVLEGEVPVVVQANDLRQLQDAITWSEEEGVRLVLLGGRDAPYVAHHLVEKEIPVLLTSVQDAPGRDWEPYDGAYSLPARLQELGVDYAIVGGSSAPYANRLPWEAGSAMAFGLSEADAIQAVTLAPARILGLGDRLGSVEVGKDATLIITTGNPLEYSTAIEAAYIQGRELDLDDAHKQFFRKYMEHVRQKQGG